MHRLAVIALFLCGCGGAATREPAWPKSAGHVVPDDWKDDGGESIDPRVPTDVEQSPSDSDDAAKAGSESLGASVGAAATRPAPASTGGATYGGGSYGGGTVQVEVTSDDGTVIDGSPPPPSLSP